MLIDTTLLVNNPEIIRGLLNGSMSRYGSVIRWSSGTEKAGQIIKHLAEAPGLTRKLADLPFSPIAGGLDFIGNSASYHKLIGIEKTLSATMSLTQIAAGASVLNLGVSVAGFIYMGCKLHQIQNSLNQLQQFIEQRFDYISGQLAYLCLLVKDNNQQQQRLAKAISHIQQTMIIREIAALSAELGDRQRFPDESPRQCLKVADQVRLFLSNQALQVTPALDAELMLNTDIAIQGWAVAIATQANLLLEIGKNQDARELMAVETPKFKQIAKKWADELIKDENTYLSTAYRFGHSRFQKHITQERIARIVDISPNDYGLSADDIRRRKTSVDVEFQMSHSTQWNKTWTNRQIVIAEYLDTLSELTARLESLQSFAVLCENQNVKTSKDILPDANAKLGLYVISCNY